ncbi:type II toxin-antitoxin system VapC family toxin [soil metagenome]
MGDLKILLDTFAFLWLANEPEKLSARAAAAIDEDGSDLFFSETSIYEIVIKHRTGRLPLPNFPRVWIPTQIEAFQLETVTIQPDAIYRSGELPPVHNDPFDRLLAAQALIAPFKFITHDPLFRAYGVDTIW